MAAQTQFDIEDAKELSRQLQNLRDVLNQEFSRLINQWHNLESTWSDDQYNEFTKSFFDSFQTDFNRAIERYKEDSHVLDKKIRIAERGKDLEGFFQDIVVTKATEVIPTLAPSVSRYAENQQIKEAESGMVKLLPILLPFVDISLDSQILQATIDSRANSQTYWRKAIGNEGELEVLKLLTDLSLLDCLTIDEIQPQHQGVNKFGRSVVPDFYIPSRNMICEAKAWKSIVESRGDITRLNDTIEKYADYLDAGGEVRLYFPKDVYEELLFEQKEDPNNAILSKLTKQHNSVSINVQPMQIDHKKIISKERMHRILFRYYFGNK